MTDTYIQLSHPNTGGFDQDWPLTGRPEARLREDIAVLAVKRRLFLAQLLACSLVLVAGRVRAQDSATPSNAELMQRIQELEARVKELKAPPPPPPDPVPTLVPTQFAVPTQADPPGSAGGEAIEALPSAGGSGGNRQGRPTRFEQQRSGELQPIPPPGGLPPGEVAGWSNGFYIQSPDQQFVAYLTGQVQMDSRWFANSADRTDIDEFLLRRARFGMEAIAFDYYEFRILADFSGSNLNAPAAPSTPTPSIVDAYGNVHYFDAVQFLAGRYKQPFSYEQLISDRYTVFLERSLMDQLTPQRDIGVMLWGQNIFDRRFDWFVSVSNGEINGNFDANNNKDVAARAVVRPFAPNEGILQYLGLGVSYTFGDQRQTPVQVSPSASFPQVLRTPLGVPWLTFNTTTTANGARQRLSPEIVYFCGPFGIVSQYFLQDQQMSPTATGVGGTRQIPVTFSGYYVMATAFLTGERREGYSRGVNPVRNFDLRSPIAHPGAWELAARVSYLHVSDNIFRTGALNNLAAATGNADGCTEMTLGINWYLNRVALMRFNWERDWFNRPVTLAPGAAGLLNKQDVFGVRFEIAF
jgi:phosphate-selective porin OprO/OprP